MLLDLVESYIEELVRREQEKWEDALKDLEETLRKIKVQKAIQTMAKSITLATDNKKMKTNN